MPSEEHRALLLAIVGYSHFEYQVLTPGRWLLCIDNHPEFESPPEIGGRRPDVYAERTAAGMRIIGEAKTSSDDLNNDHTKEQLRVYGQNLKKFTLQGENRMGVLILATPHDTEKEAFQALGEIDDVHFSAGGERAYDRIRIQQYLREHGFSSRDVAVCGKFPDGSLVSAHVFAKDKE